MVFEDINISILVEKKIKDQKIPIPLLIHKVDKISIEEITNQITASREKHKIKRVTKN